MNVQIDRVFLKETYRQIFKLKNNDFFSLLDVDFYLEEFLFFPRISAFLAAYDHLDEKKAKHLGLVSSLVYLSGKIHYTIDDKKTDKFAYAVQFPILLGDLLYGKVIKVLADGGLNACLDDYLRYLQQLHMLIVDHLNAQVSAEKVEEMRFGDLAVLTAELLGVKEQEQLTAVRDLALACSQGLQNGRAASAVTADEPLTAALNEYFAPEFIAGEPIASLEDLCQRIEQ